MTEKQQIIATEAKQDRPSPNTVLSAKVIDLALVSYTDESGFVRTQLAIVGDNTVRLLESRQLGLSKEPTPVGEAKPWLRDGIFGKLGKILKKKEG